MNVLWCGGEDIDFPYGDAPSVGLSAGSFRTGYARCALYGGGASKYSRSLAFRNGAVTSLWLNCRWYNYCTTASTFQIGLIKDPTTNAGLWIGNGGTGKTSSLTLYSFDGTTKTQLAQESGTSEGVTAPLRKIDFQIINYGASATVNVYQDNVLLLTFTGDVRATGVTSLSAVGIGGINFNTAMSEIIVCDDDTRALLGLQTLALTAVNGATTNWTNNTYTNINGTTFSDASPAYSNINNQVQDYNITDPVAGVYDILLSKITARMAKSATPAVNNVQLGYNNGAGSSAAGTGATKAVGTVYANYEQYDEINPLTSAIWVPSDITALQLELTAKT